MPAQFPFSQDRYVLEYELRHSYLTIMIGVPMKLSILMQQISSHSNWQGDSNSFGNSSGLSNIQRPLGSSDKSNSKQNCSPKSLCLKDSNSLASGKSSSLVSNNDQSLASNKVIKIKTNKKYQLGSEEAVHTTLKDSMNKFQQTLRTWQKEKLAKSRGERRKEESLWVKLLLNNLTKLNIEIEQQGDTIRRLFQEENQSRLEFEVGKKRGVASEENTRKEISRLKKKLQALQEANQQINFNNFERIQGLIDEQENKMIDMQNQMHEHANCLEQLLQILKESSLADICPYSSLINITPIDDEFFKMTPSGRIVESAKSEDANKAYISRQGVNIHSPK